MTSFMTEAIAAHRNAWQAFQQATDANVSRAEDKETAALMALLSTPAVSIADFGPLAEHLAWYCAEEEDQAGTQAIAFHAVLRLAVPALARAQALMKSVDFDNNGAMVAGQLMGGNGGLISRDTIKAADELRKALAVMS